MRRRPKLNLLIGLALWAGCHAPAVVRAQHMVEALPPVRQRRPEVSLTIEDALSLALANSDVVRTLERGRVFLPAATAYDRVIADQQTAAALAVFDTSYSANLYWNRYEGPPESFFGPGLERESRFDQGTFATGFSKRWTPGTETRIFYNPAPGYLFYPNGGSGFNPSHVAALELGVRQNVLRGGGTAVNLAPIKIAQLKSDQSAWQFKQAMLEFVRSVQEAYWDLQAARVAEQVLQQQLPLIDEVVRVEQANVAAQRSVAADLAKARTQQRVQRQRLLEARLAVQEAELRLRNVLGLDPHDQRPLILATPPLRAPVVVDPLAAMALAVDHQPELIEQRIRTRIDELDLLVAENRFRPQFDVQALYRANGLQDDLSAALDMMAQQDFYDWEFGAVFSVPLGRHADRARVRSAQWQLQRDRALLRERVRVVEYRLGEIIARIDSLHHQYREAEARVRDAQEWLRGARIRYEHPPAAGRDENWLLLALDDYLLAMRASTEAAVEASLVLAEYNTELARLEEAQGTMLATWNIELVNDPCAPTTVRKLPKVEWSAAAPVRATPELPAPSGPIVRLPPVDRPNLPPIVRLPPPEFRAHMF